MSIDALRTREEGFKGRIAYVAVYESDREEPGWYLGIAEEDSPGYWQTTWPPHPNEDEARRIATQMNLRLGLTDREAALLIATTMRGDGRVGPKPGSRRR